MPRKTSIRTVCAQNGQKQGTKRAANSKEVCLSKRRKQTTAPARHLEQEQVDAKSSEDVATRDDATFPFLALPGELRNHIYEYAADYTYRCFPPTCPKPTATRVRRTRSGPPTSFNRPIPYLALTQVNCQIRTEFRPMWLSTHRFPLFVMDQYLKAFFPRPTPTTDRKRFDNYLDPKGTLRLWIRQDDLSSADIVSLLRFKARFPEYNLDPVSNGTLAVTASDLACLSALIENTNELWKQWVRRKTLSQVRFVPAGSAYPKRQVRLVVKAEVAPLWMRPSLHAHGNVPEGYLETLGLDWRPKEESEESEDAFGVRFCFGVDYS